MSLSAEAIDAMIAAGVSAEQLAAVIKAQMAAEEKARQERRDKDAERKRKSRAVRDVTRTSCDGRGHPVTDADSSGHPVTERDGQDAPAPVHTRVEDNPSRLVDTCSAVAVVAEAREPGSDWPDGKATEHAKLLVVAAASPRLDPSKQPGLVTTAGRIDAWKRDGASWAYDVVPAVTIMSGKRGPPIGTWKYFDQAIAQSIADNRRALDIPSANGPRNERPDPPSAKLNAKQANMERSLRGAQSAAARWSV